jgi:hypothetical protein
VQNLTQSVQSEAARIVASGTKLTSIQRLYEETGWGKLLERREKHKLMQTDECYGSVDCRLYQATNIHVLNY